MSEANETQVWLCHCRDVYFDYVDVKLCDQLIEEYEIIGKQLYKLDEAWSKFSKRSKC
jgi:hypothetical protein